jgi:hypothetical protein
MHLLPHKSWNVWSKKNMDKVSKDEDELKQQEERKRKRQTDIVRKANYLS